MDLMKKTRFGNSELKRVDTEKVPEMAASEQMDY